MDLHNATTNDLDMIANKVADILEQRGHIKQHKGPNAQAQAEVVQPAGTKSVQPQQSQSTSFGKPNTPKVQQA